MAERDLKTHLESPKKKLQKFRNMKILSVSSTWIAMEGCDGHNQVQVGNHHELKEFNAILRNTTQHGHLPANIKNEALYHQKKLEDRPTPSDRIFVASLKDAVKENLVEATLSPRTPSTR